ncbi:two-component sensor histidine kinase [Tengunoibacter tsumagoiensis]|uniref:histidine kinase n=1 Tax=Tengunoibacter tsumagoiensis TaxID=2014871 RepID=A0A402A1L3_9CHLR|nr:two-component sensor histidine kinase [Tengunoibacter tsumagoiensis]
MRLRLLLLYSLLMMATLFILSVVVLWLTQNQLNQSVDHSIETQVRIALVDTTQDLKAQKPYWPDHIPLQAVDAYREPGVVVEVVDRQGELHALSNTGGQRIPVGEQQLQMIGDGQTIWMTIFSAGRHIRVRGVPIYAPLQTGSSPSSHQPVIGALLVAKSLEDVDVTMILLRTLLVISSIFTFTGALVGGWMLANSLLKPLSDMAKTAREITIATASGTRIGNLSLRVKRPSGDDEIVEVVETFNQMLSDLESAAQLQRRFVDDASHELRAPLTTVQGNLSFLQRHMEELPVEERRSMLTDAYGETLRLSQLVEQLLLLAHVDADQVSPQLPPQPTAHQPLVEVDRAVLHIVRQLRGRLEMDSAMKKSLEIEQIDPVRVRGDEESIRRIILILLDNALKYTQESQQARISISLIQQGPEALLRVRDTGIGIDAEDLPHIFERFYRADRARSRQDGTGLGLSIAQLLVERLGGRIGVKSQPGVGSTFSVWLPLA